MRFVNHFYSQWICRVIDAARVWRLLQHYPWYLSQWRQYSILSNAERAPFLDTIPQLEDQTRFSGFDQHYVYQAAWATSKLASVTRDVHHIDIGSDIEYVSMVAAYRLVTFVDIRPAKSDLHNLSSICGSILALPFSSDSVDSISCLHVAEHVGLGRYGDSLNPNGTRLACAELKRVLAPGGNLLFSSPVGKPRVCFNAHRIHDPRQFLEYFDGLQLVEFSAVDDLGHLRQDIQLEQMIESVYACGLFHFTKKS